MRMVLMVMGLMEMNEDGESKDNDQYGDDGDVDVTAEDTASVLVHLRF